MSHGKSSLAAVCVILLLASPALVASPGGTSEKLVKKAAEKTVNKTVDTRRGHGVASGAASGAAKGPASGPAKGPASGPAKGPAKGPMSAEVRFSSKERRLVYNYYGAQAKRRACPPGLARKGKGCMPPVPARKWAVGKPLPRDLDYRDLPRDLRRRMPSPPARHRYVQVAGDVLLIAARTGVVVDAIRDVLR